jgi:capsular polysaccharide biosynthesis protein
MPLPAAPVLAPKAGEAVRARRTVAPTYPSWAGGPAPWAVHFLREHLAPRHSEAGRRRLYVTRRGRDRDLTNLDDIIQLLSAHGFIEYAAGNSAEDLLAFAEAEAIVAPHGSGLAALFACRPSCVLIELFAATGVSPMYAVIAAAIGMPYVSVIGAVADAPSERLHALETSLDIPDDAARREIQEHIRQPFTIMVSDLEAVMKAHGL